MPTTPDMTPEKVEQLRESMEFSTSSFDNLLFATESSFLQLLDAVSSKKPPSVIASAHTMLIFYMLISRFKDDEQAGINPFDADSSFRKLTEKWIDCMSNGTTDIAVEFYEFCSGIEGSRKLLQ